MGVVVSCVHRLDWIEVGMLMVEDQLVRTVLIIGTLVYHTLVLYVCRQLVIREVWPRAEHRIEVGSAEPTLRDLLELKILAS